jgi:hypothetical protein
VRNPIRSRLKELHLGIPPPDQTRQNLSIAPINPLRQLLRNNRIRILSLVQLSYQRRALHIPAPIVKGPAHQGTVLIRVEHDGVGDVIRDTLCRDGEVGLKKLGAVGFAERDVIRNLSAVGRRAEVAPAYRWVAIWIKI